MEAANRVFNNTIFLYIKMIVTVFASLYSTRLVLEALGTSDFGIFNLVLGLISMLLFFNAAMTQSSQRFMSFAKGKGDIDEETHIFNISTFLHFIIAIFLVAVLYFIEPILFDNVLKIETDRIEAAKMIYRFMIISTFFVIISVPYDAVINAHENMLFVAVLGIFESLLKLAAAVYITYYSFYEKLITYGKLIVFITIILMMVKAIYSHIKYEEVRINFRKYLDKFLLKKMSSFAGYTFLGTATQMITNYGQGILLNLFFGTIVNAAQGIATQLSGQLATFAMTMLKALNPMMTKSEGSGNRELMLKASFTGARISFFLLTLFYIPVLIEMETILGIWLIEIPPYSVIFLKLLLIRNLIEQLYLTLGTAIISVGNIKSFQIYKSLLNLLPLPIGYVLFDKGAEAWAIYVIFIFYAIIQGVLNVYYAKRMCDMSIKEYLINVVFKSLLCFFIVFCISLLPYYFVENHIIRFMSVLVTSFIAFVFITWILGLNTYEKEFIKLKMNVIVEKISAKGNKSC